MTSSILALILFLVSAVHGAKDCSAAVTGCIGLCQYKIADPNVPVHVSVTCIARAYINEEMLLGIQIPDKTPPAVLCYLKPGWQGSAAYDTNSQAFPDKMCPKNTPEPDDKDKDKEKEKDKPNEAATISSISIAITLINNNNNSNNNNKNNKKMTKTTTK